MRAIFVYCNGISLSKALERLLYMESTSGVAVSHLMNGDTQKLCTYREADARKVVDGTMSEKDYLRRHGCRSSASDGRAFVADGRVLSRVESEESVL